MEVGAAIEDHASMPATRACEPAPFAAKVLIGEREPDAFVHSLALPAVVRHRVDQLELLGVHDIRDATVRLAPD